MSSSSQKDSSYAKFERLCKERLSIRIRFGRGRIPHDEHAVYDLLLSLNGLTDGKKGSIPSLPLAGIEQIVHDCGGRYSNEFIIRCSSIRTKRSIIESLLRHKWNLIGLVRVCTTTGLALAYSNNYEVIVENADGEKIQYPSSSLESSLGENVLSLSSQSQATQPYFDKGADALPEEEAHATKEGGEKREERGFSSTLTAAQGHPEEEGGENYHRVTRSGRRIPTPRIVTTRVPKKVIPPPTSDEEDILVSEGEDGEQNGAEEAVQKTPTPALRTSLGKRSREDVSKEGGNSKTSAANDKVEQRRFSSSGKTAHFSIEEPLPGPSTEKHNDWSSKVKLLKMLKELRKEWPEATTDDAKEMLQLEEIE